MSVKRVGSDIERLYNNQQNNMKNEITTKREMKKFLNSLVKYDKWKVKIEKIYDGYGIFENNYAFEIFADEYCLFNVDKPFTLKYVNIKLFTLMLLENLHYTNKIRIICKLNKMSS